MSNLPPRNKRKPTKKELALAKKLVDEQLRGLKPALERETEKISSELSRIEDDARRKFQASFEAAEIHAIRTLEADGYAVELAPYNVGLGSIRHKWVLKRKGKRAELSPRRPELNLLNLILLVRGKTAKDGVCIDLMLGMALARALLEAHQPEMVDWATRKLNQARAKKNRKPFPSTRAVLIAIKEGYSTPETIREFFPKCDSSGKKREMLLDDDLGGVSIESFEDNSGWNVIDLGAGLRRDGTRPSRSFRYSNLGNMISAIKRNQKTRR